MKHQYEGIGPLFDICQNRHQGNPMSVQANKVASKSKSGARQKIIDALGSGVEWIENKGEFLNWHPAGHPSGLTCEELEQFTGLSHQSCSARLSELRREGKIKIVGERKTRSGAFAAVYQAI